MSYLDEYYACTREVSGTGARCRNRAVNCPVHSKNPENWKPAAKPTRIEFGVDLPFDWRSDFQKVEVRYKSWSERLQSAAVHMVAAEKLGRSTNAFVGQIEREGEIAPEHRHSGTPIFGDDGGLDRVDVRSIIEKIRATGFVLTKIEILARPSERGPRKLPRLILHFTSGAEAVEFPEFPWDTFGELLETTMTYVHAWANIPGDDGSVVHTANCIIDERRQHQKPKYTLNFDMENEGYWTASRISVPAPANQTADAISSTAV